MKTRITYLYLFLCILTGSFLQAQTYTVWQQGEASDYYYNIENNVINLDGGNAVCDCFEDDLEVVFLAGSPNFEIGSSQFPHPPSHQTSGTMSYDMGPDRLHNVFGLYTVSGSRNDAQGDCTIPTCSVIFASPSIVMSTDHPYAPNNVSHSWSSTGQVILNWDIASDIPADKYSTLIYKDNTNSSNLLAEIPGHATSWTDPNCAIDTYILLAKYSGATSGQTTTRTSTQPTVYMLNSTVPDPTPPPVGRIAGQILTSNGNPVEGATIQATLQNPGAISNGNCWPSTYTTLSEPNGTYVIPFIYWGEGSDQAIYEVVPSFAGRGFDPDALNVTLRNGDANKMSVDFTDTTSFAITGFIRDANGCGVDSGFVSTSTGNSSTFSKPDGSYILTVPQTGDYTIQATLDTFDLGSQMVNVTADVQDVDFDYLETDTLNLYVGAGCFEYIGQANISVRTKGGCLLQTLQTDESGFANGIVLPKREITIEVTNINPSPVSGLDPNEVLADIGGEMLIDLDTTITFNIIYRKPLSIELSGIPSPPCPAVSHPVFNQAVSYPITIQVWESPGICLADTGSIYIQNNIATIGIEGAVLDTIPISGGIAHYNIFPGEPVLNAPFLKNITFTAVVDSSSTSTTIEGIVSGSRQRTQTFVTGGPTELPYLILRDPPGDASFTQFIQGETVTYSQSYSAKESGDVRIWGRLAGKSPKGPIRIFGEIGLGIKVGGSRISNSETKMELSDFIDVKTSEESNDIGRDHDIVYGAAVNFIYGLVDERFFDINSCAMLVDTGLMFSPDTFETKFFKSIKEIRENTIPALELFSTNPDTTEEARIKFRAELKKWERVIQYNDELREEALQNPVDNLSLDDDANLSFTTTGSSTKSKSIVTSQFINADIAAKAGIDILDESLVVEGGVEVNIRGEWGQSESNSITETTTTKFTFNDVGNQDDDLFSF
ncbi:MAG: hypothetical protein AAGK97_01665, partial [Bacteroidota bacterium]